MKERIFSRIFLGKLWGSINQSRGGILCFSLVLSWFYALCAQCIITLPLSMVPVYPHPMPIFLTIFIVGRPAFYALLLYVLQGALGAPFFTGMKGGLMVLMGPTGGYLVGFAMAALFLLFVRERIQNSLVLLLSSLFIANIIVFSCGIAQLSLFISQEKLFAFGLYPFLVGDFILKPLVIVMALKGYSLFLKS